MRFWRIIRPFMTSTIVLTAFTGLATAQPRVETPPDWPCVQVFVPTLSAASIWDGPPIDDYLKTWTDNRDVASLATRAISRSVPEEEATQAIDSFAESIKDNREQTLTMLFAGIFDEANRTRSKAIDGIRRFSRAQREQLRNMNATVSELDRTRAAQSPDAAKVKELTEQLSWQRRIVDERHRSLGALCEQPVIVERRLGTLARAIASHME